MQRTSKILFYPFLHFTSLFRRNFFAPLPTLPLHWQDIPVLLREGHGAWAASNDSNRLYVLITRRKVSAHERGSPAAAMHRL